jgi:drug/metabolite transporter (DMT)-like permease
MSLSPQNFLLCLGFSFALPAGQMLFKWGADYSKGIEGGFVQKVVFNYPLMGAFGWYGLTALFWFYILTRVPLSLAYPFSILGAGLVPILAWILFRETITPQAWLGYAIMLVGFLLIARSGG